jgi:mono/diheme cytochrome c family protein
MRFARTLLLAALLPTVLQADPLVVGFDRFHAKPDAEGGRLLYNELGCVNCHGGETGLPARRGPTLLGVTHRAQADWVRSFIADPAAARPGTAMPHMLPANDPGAAEAILAYLGSVKPKVELKAGGPRHVNGDRGRELFHSFGCAACHEPDQNFEPPEGKPKPADFTHRSVAFPKLGEKHVLSSLADFIRHPERSRTDGRMPRFEMDDQDSVDLAGYLLNYEGSDGQTAPRIKPHTGAATLVERGRALVGSLRCAACHELPKEITAPVVALKKNDGGCLAENTGPGIPRYSLTASQRTALKHYLAHRTEPVAPALLATLTLEALNCVACHERDGRGGPDAGRKASFMGDHNLGDTGKFPPPLTGIGRKLQPAWLAKVLTGEARVRPYLQTKMPIYGASVTNLAAQLAQVDGKKETPLPAGDVHAGQKLLGTLGGVSCITCHRWRDRAALGIQSLDLSNLSARIQPGWLAEYLVNPATYRPGTLMPSFWPDGKAANQEILGGNTAKQIASIYAFAAAGKGEPEGYPSNVPGQFEVIPTNHPVVMRTFMKEAGTHAILVGFPEGVHVAYDGLRARPAMAWKGKFFDAYTTWFVRAAPFEKPLGDSVVKWPEPAADGPEVRFNGYRLDAKRAPVFLSTIGGVAVEERFAASAGGLSRHLTWNAASLKTLPVAHPAGVTVNEASGSAPGKLSFTYIWK